MPSEIWRDRRTAGTRTRGAAGRRLRAGPNHGVPEPGPCDEDDLHRSESLLAALHPGEELGLLGLELLDRQHTAVAELAETLDLVNWIWS